MRSGTGALGSTCFWKLVGSAESGSWHPAAGAVWVASLMPARFYPRRLRRARERIEPVPPRPPPGELAEPAVQPEVARQPRDGRWPPQPERGEFPPDARIVRRQLHRLAQRAHRLLLVARHHQRLGEVDQRLGG